MLDYLLKKNIRYFLEKKHRWMPPEKRDYKPVSLKDLDPKDHTEAWTAKIDGAHSVVRMEKGLVPKIYSHRVSKKTLGPIEYTPKLTHIETPAPVNAILRAETYAVDRHGKAVHPDIVTAMLNRGTTNSIALQKGMGITTRTALIDIDEYDGKPVAHLPYDQKREILETIVKQNRDFHLPETAYTAEEKKKLLAEIKNGSHPQTKEGVVVHKLDERSPFFKAKLTSDHDVVVRKIFAEESTTGRPAMAGGFSYSWTKNGPIVGAVGSGFSHQVKEDMLLNPEKYLGRVAKIKAHDVSKNNVLIKPSFTGWHVEKNIDLDNIHDKNPASQPEKWQKQTVIVSKSMASDRKKAEEIARTVANRIYTARETSQSYRFRQMSPEKFEPGQYKTLKLPEQGVSIVYGKLRE